MTISGDDLRLAARLCPTGVAVVTTEPDNLPAFGITINSFTTLSLNPPLVMWNLQKGSGTYREWHEADNFAVNFLKADQQDLSTKHATQGGEALPEESIARGVTNCPMMADCLFSLECKVHARYEEGDHVIMIGEVVNIATPNPDADALIYLKGGYTKAQ